MWRKICFLLVVLQIFVLAAFAPSAFAANAATRAFSAAYKDFRTVVERKGDAQKVLDAFLAIDAPALSAYSQAHHAFCIGDLYYRIGDYEKCKEWTLKVINSKELSDTPVTHNRNTIYGHGLTAAAILANAAAEYGKPEDIDMIESKLTAKDMTTRVFTRYCWIGPRMTLRTMLRFYKALAYKNAGNIEAMQEIVQSNLFKTGDIRVGNKFIPLEQAAKLFAFASGGGGGTETPGTPGTETPTASFAGSWTTVSGTHNTSKLKNETSVAKGELTIYVTGQTSSSISVRLDGRVDFANGGYVRWWGSTGDPVKYTKISDTKIQATVPFTWTGIQFNPVRVLELTDENTLVLTQNGSRYENGAATFTLEQTFTFTRNQ